MKIFTPAQTRGWDQATIQEEKISSIELMERAGISASSWILNHYPASKKICVFCGPGNNGGDGFVVARKLWQGAAIVEVFLWSDRALLSDDNSANRKKFESLGGAVTEIKSVSQFPKLSTETLVVDALLGSGLNRPPSGLLLELIQSINNSGATVIAIDQPSGLLNETTSAIKATDTLSFQSPKLSFFLPENDSCIGQVHILDIGLDEAYYKKTPASFETTELQDAVAILRPRPRSGHKGNFGHAALLAGSWGMMGAAMLAAKACLRSGVGKLTCLVTEKTYPLLQTAVPESIFRIQAGEDFVRDAGALNGFEAIGFGCGWGMHPDQKSMLEQILAFGKLMVIDADALNLIGQHRELLERIPADSILTPHPREFDQLTTKHKHSMARWETALEKASSWNVYIVLKGHHTLIATPDGKGYINTTGNAGMATAGTGDVLTGIITGLLSQGYSPFEASTLGVYIHGLAGDIAAQKTGEEAMLAGDIISNLGNAYKKLRRLTD